MGFKVFYDLAHAFFANLFSHNLLYHACASSLMSNAQKFCLYLFFSWIMPLHPLILGFIIVLTRKLYLTIFSHSTQWVKRYSLVFPWDSLWTQVSVVIIFFGGLPLYLQFLEEYLTQETLNEYFLSEQLKGYTSSSLSRLLLFPWLQVTLIY